MKDGSAVYYPLRSICESLGMSVNWDATSRTATVTLREHLVLSPKGTYALVLDVRTPAEYDAGHLEGAINLPVQELGRRIGELAAYKDQPVLVYCKAGTRSAQTVDLLLEDGFMQLYHWFRGYDSLTMNADTEGATP